jgi:hypothetical protein
MRKRITSNNISIIILILTAISAFAYLPWVSQIGYMNDDWYLMYSAGAYGPEAFIDIFSVDRPARALVMMPVYALFGENPLYYNLSAFVLRLVSAIGFLWLLRMVFPRQDRLALFGSLFFLIYLGFLSQPNGIDYQNHLVGLAAAHLSIALTVRAVLTDRFALKSFWFALSILLGLLYLSQMEWYIGFELFRWGSVFLLSSRSDGSLIQKAWRAVRWASPSFAVPGIFLVWRIFFFKSERGATDVNIQFGQVISHPIQTVYYWIVQVFQDLFDVMFSAWVTPLSQLMGFIQQWGVVLAVLAAAVVLLVFRKLEEGKSPEPATQVEATREALLLGLFVAIGGLIPIAMVNREVVFPSFSRYSLVSSAGVALFFSALILWLRSAPLRNGLVALLVVISVLTHHANTVKTAQQTASTRSFWWQVSWRVPHLGKNTTLIAHYPGVPIEEDYFVWDPANLIYYPEKQNEKNIQPGVYAALLNTSTIEKVHARERQEYDKRKTITTYANYRNILVLTQAGENSCVHVLDGSRPEYSSGEWEFIREVGSYSEIEHVLTEETPHTPPPVVFGPEPDHGWCYYYQKADLARQRGEWDEVQRIGEQALGQGFEPKDMIEWMPFLQAYAVSGDAARLTELAPIIGADPYISQQACQILGAMRGLSDSVQAIIKSQYCLE